MISTILSIGNKVELVQGQKKHLYKSKIMDILDEETLKLSLPIEGSVVIPLEKGSHFELVFYCGAKLYSCRGEITERYKENKLYLMNVRLTSELEKLQRRKFYRLSYAMDIKFREFQEEENPLPEEKELPWLRGTTVDISGGGCRFNAPTPCKVDTKLEVKFDIALSGGNYKQEWLGKVTYSQPVPNREGVYETRVEFLGEERGKREQLIKFIFEIERKMRQKERGMDT